MNQNQEYDEELKNVRIKIAMEKSEWYTYFQLRNKFLNWMIFSFFAVWTVLAILMIILNYNFLYIAIVPYIIWIFLVAPFFSLKIYFLSKRISEKKEEIVLKTWEVTKDINQIVLSTGMEENFVTYYLKKNGLYGSRD